jgi:multidrug resistance efflux pump
MTVSFEPQARVRAAPRQVGTTFRPGLFVNARLFRLIIGLALIGSAAWYGYLYTFNKVSIAGVVNAPLITVVSQLDGHVAGDVMQRGAALRAGETIATVVNQHADNRTAMDLKGALNEAHQQLAALRANIDDLNRLKADLEKRSQNYRAAWIDHVTKAVTEEEAVLASARVLTRQTADALKRGTSLVAKGAVSVANFDDLSYVHQRARSTEAQAEATLARRQSDLVSAKAGIVLSDGNWSDVPYSSQRLDEINIRLAELDKDKAVLTAKIAEIEAKHAAEEARIARLSREPLAAPVDGVVWRSTIATDAAVVRSAPLMEIVDCTHVYVEATARERFFESLQAGRQVRVQLAGSNKEIPGIIREVVGPGAALTTTSNVAVMRHSTGTEAQLIVDLDRSAMPPTAGSMCNVGRSATVYFD